MILTGDIKVEKEIDVTGHIDCAGYLIEAGGSIKTGYSIEAGGSIKAGGSIEARLGITAFLKITCKTTLKAGLRIIAGVCNWREITDEDKTITCGKLEGGEIVGILKETEIEDEKDYLIKDGKRYLVQIIKQVEE